MSLGSERGAVQNPFIRYAVEAGWAYLSPEDALDRRRGLTSPALDAVLIEQLQKLNPGVVDHLQERQRLYGFYRELGEVYEIPAPDSFLRPFLEDYEDLTSLYRVVRANYERSIPVDKSFLRKTAKLVQEHTRTEEQAKTTERSL